MWLCTDYLEYVDYDHKLAYGLKHRWILDFHLKFLACHLKLSESFSLYYIQAVEISELPGIAQTGSKKC